MSGRTKNISDIKKSLKFPVYNQMWTILKNIPCHLGASIAMTLKKKKTHLFNIILGIDMLDLDTCTLYVKNKFMDLLLGIFHWYCKFILLDYIIFNNNAHIGFSQSCKHHINFWIDRKKQN